MTLLCDDGTRSWELHFRFGRAVSLLALFMALPAFSQTAKIVPQLHPGEILVYQFDFTSSRDTRVQSRVTTPEYSPSVRLDSSGLLQVQVVTADGSGFRLKTYFSEKHQAALDGSNRTSEGAPDKVIEVVIAADGTASQTTGLDRLSAAQQFAWNNWLGDFASFMKYRSSSLHVGRRWETLEPERTPFLISGLFWKKRYDYARDEPCGLAGAKSDRASAPQTCAVILVRSELRQKSSPKNATPPDYKLRNLTTRGTASGAGETVLYISRSTGLLVRAREETQQSMDATVALADSSNDVRYVITAKSRSQVQLLPDSPQDIR